MSNLSEAKMVDHKLVKRVLILSANPQDTTRLRLDKEVREIQGSLKLSANREQFEIITEWATRIDDLRRALLHNQPALVHFSGHGLSEGLVLENDLGQRQLVSSESLAKLFELFKDSVECVLLNACYSEEQGEAIYQNIDCVVGMNNSIEDEAAIHFSKAFYDAITAGRSYVDAFKFGCNNIDLNHKIKQSFVPVIKSRNDSATFLNLEYAKACKEEKTAMSNNSRTINMNGDGNYNEDIKGNFIQGNYYESSHQKSDLAEAATEIQKLLETLEKSYATDTTLGKMQIAAETVQEIENDPSLSTKIMSALKAGGIQAFEQFLNHPAASFVMGALEDWQKTKSF